MTRVLLIPMVLVLALPARADDELETKLQEIEARVAKLRAEAKHEAEEGARLDDRIAALDKKIAERKRADPTALGATKIADLEVERDELRAAKRSRSRALAREAREAASSVEQVERSRAPLDPDALLKAAQQGDANARGELARLRERINAVVPVAVPQQGALQIVALGGGGGQIFRGAIVPPVGVRQVPATAPRPAEPNTVVPPAEQEKLDAQDLTDQQRRAAELEARIVEMTRKLMDLERRVAELKQKVAQPDRG